MAEATTDAISPGRQATTPFRDTLKGLKGNALVTAKEELCVQLREAGWSYVRIAKELGYAQPSGALRAYRRGRAYSMAEPTDEQRLLWVARMDELLRAFWPAARRGDPRAAKVILDIADYVAKLQGLYAAERTEVLLETVQPEELEQVVEKWKRELAELEG